MKYRDFFKNLFKEKDFIYDNLSSRVKEELDYHLSFYKSELLSLMDKCESPIEQLFALSLKDGVEQLRNSLYVFGADCDVNFYPQKQIVVRDKKYRVDFVLSVTSSEQSKEYVVECDGHNFHEKTKEQAARDRERERRLMSLGYTVIRFTGSEIWKDPSKCVRQLMDIVNSDFKINEAWASRAEEDMKGK